MDSPTILVSEIAIGSDKYCVSVNPPELHDPLLQSTSTMFTSDWMEIYDQCWFSGDSAYFLPRFRVNFFTYLIQNDVVKIKIRSIVYSDSETVTHDVCLSVLFHWYFRRVHINCDSVRMLSIKTNYIRDNARISQYIWRTIRTIDDNSETVVVKAYNNKQKLIIIVISNVGGKKCNLTYLHGGYLVRITYRVDGEPQTQSGINDSVTFLVISERGAKRQEISI